MLLTSEKYTRKQLLGNTNPWVGLIVLEQHIVAWLKFLDKAIFEIKSLFLAVDHNISHIPDIAYEQIGAHHRMHAIEIRTHAALQVFGLSHINYYSFPVQVLIHAWTIGKE